MEFKSNTEDTEMADCEDEKVVTMMDVLQEQEDFEEDANAVLGASDDKNCTYSKGYIKRQAVYACMTCCFEAKNDPSKSAGVCLACCLTCHENHELIELYTKRNFKCDCGNAKFSSHPCQFTPNKEDINEDNSYNQNFSGVYCICHRPYPDPESTGDDEMIQCIICEDWLHASHLDATVPDNDQYSEMICKSCMEQNNFLHDYSNLAVNIENVDMSMTNGIDNDDNTVCNGDDKLNESCISIESGNLKLSTDVEKVELNISSTKIAIDNVVQSIDHKNIIEICPNNVTDNETNEMGNKIIDNDSSVTNKVDKKIVYSDSSNSEAVSIEAEYRSDEQSIDMLMETHESKKLDSHGMSNIDTSIINEPSHNLGESEDYKINKDSNKYTIKDICMTSGNAEKDVSDNNDSNTKDNTFAGVSDSETVNQEPQNVNENVKNEPNEIKIDNEIQTTENKSSITNNELEKIEVSKITDSENEATTSESVTEPGNIKISAEQMEEDRLLADPEDANDTHVKKNKNNNESEVFETNDLTLLEKSNTNALPQLENEENVACKSRSDLNSTNMDNTKPEIVNEEHETDDNASSTKDENETIVTPMQEDNSDENNICQIAMDSIESKKEQTENKLDPRVLSVTNNEYQNLEVTANSSEKVAEKRKISTQDINDMENKKPKLVEFYNELCKRPQGVHKVYKGATFWPSTFRQKLCTCRECTTMYKDLSVLFLIDPEDTVTAYENLGKQNINGKPASQYEKGLQALSSLDRIQQINALTEYNKMRDKLLDFLKSFKDRKEVVKEEDIKAFFAGMKPKREPDGVYFCK